jgi:hypothetical protein
VKAITEYPRPKNVKEVRRLLGLFNWFRKFIPNYSALVNPLTRLLKKGQLFHWRNEQETAFSDLKQKIRFDFPVKRRYVIERNWIHVVPA